MKIILSSLAALVGVVGAGAAELPSLKPPPTAHAKSCTIGGMTGVMLPGSDTCVKIGGYVSVGVTAGNLGHSSDRN
jgi:Porin subfamily